MRRTCLEFRRVWPVRISDIDVWCTHTNRQCGKHRSHVPARSRACGRAHFELYHHGQPVVTDVGVSTYEKNERRLLSGQRQATTASPGETIRAMYGQAPCWSAAKVKLLQDTESSVVAEHDGHPQAHVKRSYESVGEGGLAIIDHVLPKRPLQNLESANCIFIQA